jgi:hypothetical protein
MIYTYLIKVIIPVLYDGELVFTIRKVNLTENQNKILPIFHQPEEVSGKFIILDEINTPILYIYLT